MQQSTAELAAELEAQLMKKHGPLLGGSALYQALGYKSAAAVRQAKKREQIGVQLFTIQNRRGKYALTLHVAQWLAECATAAPQAGPDPCGEATSL